MNSQTYLEMVDSDIRFPHRNRLGRFGFPDHFLGCSKHSRTKNKQG